MSYGRLHLYPFKRHKLEGMVHIICGIRYSEFLEVNKSIIEVFKLIPLSVRVKGDKEGVYEGLDCLRRIEREMRDKKYTIKEILKLGEVETFMPGIPQGV